MAVMIDSTSSIDDTGAGRRTSSNIGMRIVAGYSPALERRRHAAHSRTRLDVLDLEVHARMVGVAQG